VKRHEPIAGTVRQMFVAHSSYRAMLTQTKSEKPSNLPHQQRCFAATTSPSQTIEEKSNFGGSHSA
jgi:hypothetical protein